MKPLDCVETDFRLVSTDSAQKIAAGILLQNRSPVILGRKTECSWDIFHVATSQVGEVKWDDNNKS